MEFTKPENLTKEQLHQDVTEHFRENKVVHPITNKDSTYIQNGMSGVGIIFYNNKIRVQGAANIFNPLVFVFIFVGVFAVILLTNSTLYGLLTGLGIVTFVQLTALKPAKELEEKVKQFLEQKYEIQEITKI